MEKQKKSVGTTLLVVLLLIVTIAALVLATFAWARYTQDVTPAANNATANVAKWNVNATVDGTAQYTKDFEHVVNVKLAPGTSGVIPVTVNLNDTEVCVDYEITITGVTNKPTHLSFYKGAYDGTNYTIATGASAFQGTETATPIITGTLDLDDHNTVNATDYTNATEELTGPSVTEYIYWDWPYSYAENTTANKTEADEAAYDAVDTQDGINAEQMIVSIKIVATQVRPQ